MKRIILTGGGSAGHVTPNLALLPKLKELGYDIHYIGSRKGIEKSLVADANLPYHAISSGKLRRYFSWQNFVDPFKIGFGFIQAVFKMIRIKPGIVFSKGGFVTVPVVYAAKLLRVPVIIHESDFTPGLANKLSAPMAKKICTTFPETLKHLPKEKAVHTGSPIRASILSGSSDKGYHFTGLSQEKPVVLVMGGSLGAKGINDAIRSNLDRLLEKYQIIHLCGKDHVDEGLKDIPGYVQYGYVKQELSDIFAITDLMVSRAGANAICEIAALSIPNILIPLPLGCSRGDQILNAASFEKQGFSKVLPEEDVTADSLMTAIDTVYANRASYVETMSGSQMQNGVDKIIELIEAERK